MGTSISQRAHNVYRREVGKQLNIYCLWPPNAGIALGDYGIFNNEVFDKDGNIFQDLGLDVNNYLVAPGGTIVNNQLITHKSSLKTKIAAGAGGAVGPAAGNVDLELSFDDSDSFIFSIQNIRSYSIQYDRVLEAEIENRWNARPRSWVKSHRLLSHVWNVGRFKFAYSASRRSGINLSATAAAPGQALEEVQLNFGIEITVNSDVSISYDNETKPFIRSAFYHTGRRRLQTTRWDNKA